MTYNQISRVFTVLIGMVGIPGIIVWLIVFFVCFFDNLSYDYKPA